MINILKLMTNRLSQHPKNNVRLKLSNDAEDLRHQAFDATQVSIDCDGTKLMSDLFLFVNDFQAGKLQEIRVNVVAQSLHIGHVALDERMLSLEQSSLLMNALRQVYTEKFGVNKILFERWGETDYYDILFRDMLGAVKQSRFPSGINLDQYSWEFSKNK